MTEMLEKAARAAAEANEMTNQYENVSLTTARDYRFNSGYEYVIMADLGDDNWEVLERQGHFKSKAQAAKAGAKAAEKFLAPVLFLMEDAMSETMLRRAAEAAYEADLKWPT